MTYDGSTLSLYVNPAASDGEETFLSTENPGNSRFNSAPRDYQRATNCGSAPAQTATRQASSSLG
jgi:hypothetical protein